MGNNSETLKRLEAPKSIKDKKETKQLLPPPPTIRKRKHNETRERKLRSSSPTRKRKCNETRETKLKPRSVRKRPAPPPAPLRSPQDMKVLPDQAKGKSSSKRKVDLSSRRADSSSLNKARQLQIKLGSEIPSFIKFMRRSHVSSCFWLRIPREFCKLNMPKKDCSILLVDSKGEEYNTQYHDEKGGLGGGWKRFSSSHHLVEGDSVVFQLVEPTKFKVYVIGKNGLHKCSQGAGNPEEILIEDANADQEASHSLCVTQEGGQNERRERNAKRLCVNKRPAPSSPRHSPEYMQVLPYQAKKDLRCKQKMDWTNEEAKSCSMKKAKEFQMKLAPEMPSLVKFMLPSMVSRTFLLSLTADFCKLNMPKNDCIIMLVNESGEKFEIKYFANRVGLSGGWRTFSTAHELVEGDSVVFHLVEPTTFKVYIFGKDGLRKCSQMAGDRALEKEMLTADEGTFRPLCILQENNHNVTPPGLETNPGDEGEIDAGDLDGNSCSVATPGYEEDIDTEDLEGNRSAASTVAFKDVKSYEDFTIIVNGWNVDSQLSGHVRAKYYELCCSQQAFLHDKMNPVISCKSLIAGIISEIVNVAEFLKSCNLTTAENEFKNWENCLHGFEILGINVGFLHARLHQLETLGFKSEGSKDLKMYNEKITKRTCLEEEVRRLEMELLELKEVHASSSREVGILEVKAKQHERNFLAKVNDPW